MLRLSLVLLLALLSWPQQSAVAHLRVASPLTYYVSDGTGSDTANDGLSAGTPFKTVQKAASLTNPGDTVLIMAGTYAEYSGAGIVDITRSGTPNAYITYKAYPGQHPVFHTATAWNHIQIAGAAYIRIEGIEIAGNNPNITYDEAYAQRNNPDNAPTNTNGILIKSDSANQPSHHIEVLDNIVHDCPGGGIAVLDSDYIKIEHNQVYSNSLYTVYATSGISLYHSTDVDNNTGYKNFVVGNQSYNNQTLIPWIATGEISDGNGIIIDDNKHTQSDNVLYKGRTLVANNLSYNNGGSGIHSYESSYVDIVNNTAYLNSKSPSLDYAGIGAWYSTDVNLVNNISYIRSGKSTNSNYANTNVTYDYNIYFNGNTPAVQGSHDLVTDPLFVNPTTDPVTANFSLQATSPAVDSGTTFLAPSADLLGQARPQGLGYERGAYEYYGATLVVTEPTDDGQGSTAGSLSYVLKQIAPGQTVSFNIKDGSHTVKLSGTLPPLPAGVTIDGGCTNGPGITLDGTTASGNGLVVAAHNVRLHGLKVINFPGKPLVVQRGFNALSSCLQLVA